MVQTCSMGSRKSLKHENSLQIQDADKDGFSNNGPAYSITRADGGDRLDALVMLFAVQMNNATEPIVVQFDACLAVFFKIDLSNVHGLIKRISLVPVVDKKMTFSSKLKRNF